eukprot:TRINITY_DN750_c0_g1_i1.p3 TRINITY_DN750_c0_g1~~TRINITY_DN750_c0_g1_i1.p3  ORF type:complete len:52 (+),score=10.81 TRINITY_DN750_c0_g1_i1:168-323(+)
MNLSSVDNIVLKARRQRGGVKAEQLGYLLGCTEASFPVMFQSLRKRTSPQG